MVKLSVHVNTKARERSREVRDRLAASAKAAHAKALLSGYIVVYFNRDGEISIEVDSIDDPVPYPMLQLASDALGRLAVDSALTEIKTQTPDADDQQS